MMAAHFVFADPTGTTNASGLPLYEVTRANGDGRDVLDAKTSDPVWSGCKALVLRGLTGSALFTMRGQIEPVWVANIVAMAATVAPHRLLRHVPGRLVSDGTDYGHRGG